MKAIFINGSPRKNKNTAQMLEATMRGAQEAGAEVGHCSRTARGSALGVQCAKVRDFWHSRGANIELLIERKSPRSVL